MFQGETKTYSKKGYRIPGYFLSVLPGGNGTEYGFGPTGNLQLSYLTGIKQGTSLSER